MPQQNLVTCNNPRCLVKSHRPGSVAQQECISQARHGFRRDNPVGAPARPDAIRDLHKENSPELAKLDNLTEEYGKKLIGPDVTLDDLNESERRQCLALAYDEILDERNANDWGLAHESHQWLKDQNRLNVLYGTDDTEITDDMIRKVPGLNPRVSGFEHKNGVDSFDTRDLWKYANARMREERGTDQTLDQLHPREQQKYVDRALDLAFEARAYNVDQHMKGLSDEQAELDERRKRRRELSKRALKASGRAALKTGKFVGKKAVESRPQRFLRVLFPGQPARGRRR